MSSPEHCVTMARYNAWQNKMMRPVLEGLPEKDLRKDRKAFFGSILKTANHLLWGDLIWMSRFDGGVAPQVGIPQSVDMQPTLAAWSAERFRLDGRILTWAEKLRTLDLRNDLTWFSGALGHEVTKPLALCVTHMFNHQTHHRGQIHTMITAAGSGAWVTDLFVMPEDGPWL